jgi:hypothetical protein
MPRQLVVRQALRRFPIRFSPAGHLGHLCHAVPLLDSQDILRAGDTAQALCGLVPQKGWDTRPCPDLATAETVTCPRCRRWLAKEVPQ